MSGAAGLNSDFDHRSLCPSCRRYIGPVDVCPYCDSPAYRSTLYGRLRVASTTLALFGVLFLYLFTTNAKPAVVQVCDITPRMNLGHVRITGAVAGKPYVSGDYMSFLLDDGTGAIRVAAVGPVAKDLIERHRVPRQKEEVQVCGTLTARGNRMRLQLRTAGDLDHTRKTRTAVPESGLIPE